MKLDQVTLVSIVDDDESVRDSLKSLVRSFGYSVETFGSAAEFLESSQVENTDCLVTDVQMPGLSGVELQNRLLSVAIICQQYSFLPLEWVAENGFNGVACRNQKHPHCCSEARNCIFTETIQRGRVIRTSRDGSKAGSRLMNGRNYQAEPMLFRIALGRSLDLSTPDQGNR